MNEVVWAGFTLNRRRATLKNPVEDFKSQLHSLLVNFDADKAHYMSKAYLEAQVRTDFITPLFESLGWDVINKAGLRHDARDVIVEKGEADTAGRPDYSFRGLGRTKFFVEVKSPSESLSRHVLQAKKYVWNTRTVFFVVLTNFVEFRFYDATLKPDERKPDEGILLRLSYRDYLQNAEKLWEFSKARVLANSLDAMLPRDRRTQRLRIPVDEAFLEEMSGWREDLARAVYKNNPELTAKPLNEVVQRLLDRIVFIRIAEDRHLIEKDQLRDAVEFWKARGGKFHIFDSLNLLFRTINEDVNGEIFKPHFSESISVDSGVLANIIERLYPPKSPYRFDVIGVELLGSIYERYLGKTVRPTAKTIRIEQKPELVRKAGGVYYTPSYIVDYIVKKTVGQIIDGKTPKQIEKIRILDPACGSGSFLIGAFQYLIDHHVHYLAAHPKEARTDSLFPDLISESGGSHRLSVRLKSKILRDNLYGVDIDPQAVEITMMSLYLKALEGEKSQLPPKESLLPELKYNIMCGNSLIESDIYNQDADFSTEEKERINTFDWTAEATGFGRIEKEGWFDCVIGNPPYVSFGLRGTGKAEGHWADYMRARYTSAEYKLSLYAVFLEKTLSVVGSSGRLGFILPDSFLLGRFFSRLRDYILAHSKIQEIALFQEDFWKSGVVGRPTIIILERSDAPVSKRHAISAVHFPTHESTEKGGQAFRYPQTYFENTPLKRFRLFFSQGDFDLVGRMEKQPLRLGNIVSFASGLIGLDGKDSIVSSHKVNASWHRGIVSGSEISRYVISHGGAYICFDESKLKSGFKEARYFEPKLFLRQTGDSLTAAYDDAGLLCLNNLHVGNVKDADYDLRFILAILNSSLLNHFYRLISLESGRAMAQTDIETIELLPIPAADSHTQTQLSKLVDRLISLKRRKNSGEGAPREIDQIERELSGAESDIDNLVYGMYGIAVPERADDA